MNRLVKISLGAVSAAVLVACGGGGGGGMVAALGSVDDLEFGLKSEQVRSTAPLTGAIFTTMPGCSLPVNANTQYTSPQQVHLNGGGQGVKLPRDTFFYLRVTTPSGVVLGSSVGQTLKTDGNGVLVTADGTACPQIWANVNKPDGGPTGYNTTSNPGGVYIAQLSTSPTFDPRFTKFDAFKLVQDDDDPQPPNTVGVTITKFFDRDRDGVRDEGEVAIPTWWMNLSDQLGNSIGNLATPGASWTVLSSAVDFIASEFKPVTTGLQRWKYSGYSATGVTGTPSVSTPTDGPYFASVTFTRAANQSAAVDFGNYCYMELGAGTIGYWGNKNGLQELWDFYQNPLSGTARRADLQSLRLWMPNATNPFIFSDSGTYEPKGGKVTVTGYLKQINDLLRTASSTDMRNMLSAQYLAFYFNVRFRPSTSDPIPQDYALELTTPIYFGDDPTDFYTGSMTIAQIETVVRASLNPDNAGMSWNTRSNQEALKNLVERLNKNENVLFGQSVSDCVTPAWPAYLTSAPQ